MGSPIDGFPDFTRAARSCRVPVFFGSLRGETYRYDNFLGILLASLVLSIFAGVAQPGQTPKGEPQRRTHNYNVGDPEVAGSKTPLSETPAPGT